MRNGSLSRRDTKGTGGAGWVHFFVGTTATLPVSQM
jgi:hypothetical protein